MLETCHVSLVELNQSAQDLIEDPCMSRNDRVRIKQDTENCKARWNSVYDNLNDRQDK